LATHFLVIAPSKEIAYKVREIICDFLTIRGLELSLEKTLITHINDGFDFLVGVVRQEAV